MKDFSSILINPFEKLSDQSMLRIGFIGYLIASLQVYFFHYVPDGIFQLHTSTPPAWYAGLVNNAINILVPTTLLFALGKLLYAKTRWLDVFIVMLLSQVIITVIAFILINPFMQGKSFGIARAVEQGDKTLETVPFYTLTAAADGLWVARI